MTFIKLPFVINIFVLSIFDWPLKTGFTVFTFHVKCKYHFLTNTQYKMFNICRHPLEVASTYDECPVDFFFFNGMIDMDVSVAARTRPNFTSQSEKINNEKSQ